MITLLSLVSLGTSIRLINIFQPFVDDWSWRQADVAMIAENFYLHGFNILYPQINWAGHLPGYVGTEFPLLPFLASLLYVFFGVQEWIGRSLSVFFFALSVPSLYLLVKKVANERSAMLTVGIYNIMPLALFSSRSFMPDMMSLSFSIIALYVFARWLGRPIIPSKLFFAATGAVNLAILVKLPAILIGLPLIYMAWQEHGVKMVRRRELWIFAASSLMFPLLWYFHAHLISIAHSPHHMFGSGGIGLESLTGYENILRRAATSSMTPLLSAIMLVGIFLPFPAKYGRLFHWWLLAIFVFAIIAARGHRHTWYLLPMTPIVAAFGGRALDFLLSKIAQLGDAKAGTLSSLIFFSSLCYLSFVYVSPLYEPWAMPALEAGNELNRIAPAQALIIVSDSGDPTCLYYSRRKGWHFLEDFGKAPSNSQEAISELETLRGKGAAYLTFIRNTFWWLDYFQAFRKHLDSHYRRISVTADYIIFDLTPVNIT